MEQLRTMKLVLVGNGNVGKTCLFQTFAVGVFPGEYIPTVFDSIPAPIIVDGTPVYLTLWDTAGQSEYDMLRPLAYPQTDVFVVCASVIDPTSFEQAKERWVAEVRYHCPNTPILLVGTKTDLRENAVVVEGLRERNMAPVTLQAGQGMAHELGLSGYAECSAMMGINVREAFQTAMRTVLGPENLHIV